MNTVFLGASKGIGYFTLLNLLQNDRSTKAICLLRKPDLFNADARLQPFIEEGRITIVKGDATNEDDIRKLFQGGNVDLVVSSIGGAPKITWTGFSIDQPHLCTHGSIALLHVLQSLNQPTLPRVIVISSMGIGSAHDDMYTSMKLLYHYTLEVPHQDKMSLEYLFHKASVSLPNMVSPRDIPPKTLLSQENIDSIKENFLPEVIIVRPAAFFSSDETMAPKEKVRVEEKLKTYSIKRTEVARFIAEDCIPGNQTWVNKCPVIGY
ncbi:uncharacterized protein IL334_004797 [Kwoniella shivajii]|uniref:NAD(P)-binding domain-containing protein n=1 Tax=Kwoniella shivajii TaxID=564305 RepID=A0ABZ1D1C6_9TREE|nr:hypothetical protein IL334_004797 [Kwoniella shivajii]